MSALMTSLVYSHSLSTLNMFPAYRCLQVVANSSTPRLATLAERELYINYEFKERNSDWLHLQHKSTPLINNICQRDEIS